MNMELQALILSAALFLAMLLNLAMRPSFSVKLNAVFTVVGAVSGLIFYGIGYLDTTGDLLLTVIRTPLSVIGMLLGQNNLAAIQGSRLVSNPVGLAIFWILQLIAFYATASAAMITIGARAVRQLRFLLSRRGDLALIYGLNDRSLSIGRDCRAAGLSVVFLAESADDTLIRDLNNMGMSVLLGQEALRPDPRWVRRNLDPAHRMLGIYALDEGVDSNLSFALCLREALQELDVPPEHTRISLPGVEDILTGMLQVSETDYGYGHVYVYDRAMLAARALVQACPPCGYLHFDSGGRAVEDFACAIIGFGQHGQAVLKQLVMNGQFVGSRFRADVFSPDYEREAGYLTADCPGLLENYEISFHAEDGRSSSFYSFVGQHLETLRMIVVCTGSDEMNREISDNLMLYLQRRKAEQILVVRCGQDGVRYQDHIGSPIVTVPIYTGEMLSAEKADRSAILLNGLYDRSDRSDWQKWIACDSFSKMSSRASADFLPSFIRISGSSREAILAGDWHPDPEMQQVLGETEHLRWCAFHYAMGYSTMSLRELEERAQQYQRSLAEGKPCSIRIAKDAGARRHACLVPWDALDALSREEHRLTGREVDYKQLDIDNVLALPRILQAELRAEECRTQTGVS